MLRKRTGPQGSCSSPFISSVPSVHGIRKGRFRAHMCARSGGVLDALDIKTFSNVPYYVTIPTQFEESEGTVVHRTQPIGKWRDLLADGD